MGLTLRPYVTSGIAVLSVGITALTPAAPPPLDAVTHRTVRLTSSDDYDPSSVLLEVGGSGAPIPSPFVQENVRDVYVEPHFPGTDTIDPVGYPSQLYPIVDVHNGFFDPSVAVGTTILDGAINRQIAAGHDVVVWGQSQGATVETVEMDKLAGSATAPNPDQLAFVMTGDPDAPNGGMLERFNYPDLPHGLAPDGLPGNLTIPTVGTTFIGATPADTPYTTDIYQGEYDAFSDFPRYPIDLLADVNALLGIAFVHVTLPGLSPAEVATASELSTSVGYDGNTTYYLIPEQLPLLDLIRGNPAGNAIADLLAPDLKVLINLGYGSDNLGYSDTPADVPTTASGLFPDVNPVTVLNELVAGAKEGIQNFGTDLHGITLQGLTAAMTSAQPAMTVTPMDLDPSNFATALQTVLTENSNALATLTASSLDTFMPGVDDGTALVTTLPTFDVNLVIAGLEQLADGNTQQAFDYLTDPIGDTVGLGSIASFEFISAIESAVATITGTLQTVATEDMDFLAGLPGLL